MKRLVSNRHFIGHIGGDDFVVITKDFSAPLLCRGIVKEFEKQILNYYDPEDIHNGYITTKNRHGQIETFPLITLSVAGITNEKSPFPDKAALSEQLAALKKLAKTQQRTHQIWH